MGSPGSSDSDCATRYAPQDLTIAGGYRTFGVARAVMDPGQSYAERVNRTDLVAELAKKSGLLWISYAGRAQAVWHEWVGDAVCVVAGGSEQPLPDLERHETVLLSLRSKSTRALVAEAHARVEIVAPGSEHWDSVTTALKAGRLNLIDSDHAIQRWARESVVVRLVPTGEVAVPSEIATTIGHTAPHLTR